MGTHSGFLIIARAVHRTHRYGWYMAVSHGRGRTVEAWQGRVRVRLWQQP